MSITNVELPVSEQMHYEVLEFAANAIKEELSVSDAWHLAGLRVGYKLPAEDEEDSDQEYKIVYGNLKAVEDVDDLEEEEVEEVEDWIKEWEDAYQKGQVPLSKDFVDYLYNDVKGKFAEITGVDNLVVDVSAVIKGNPYVAAGAGCCPMRKRAYYYGGRKYCHGPC